MPAGSVPEPVRADSVLGLKVRMTGPRARSGSATTTFDLLGTWNTMPVALPAGVGHRDELAFAK
jgi:hypothetical protein